MAILEAVLTSTPKVFCDHYIILSIFSIILYFLYRTIIYPAYLSPLRHIPGPPILPSQPSSSIFSFILSKILGPFTGQFPAIINGEAGIPQREWLKTYAGGKGVLRVVGPVGIERVMFLNPEACDKILVRECVDYPRPKFMKDVMRIVSGYGLLTVEKDEHRHMRKMMNPAFSLSNLVSQLDQYHDAIESLIKIFNDLISSEKEGKILPVYEWLSKATLDIICNTALSYNADSLHSQHSELADAYERMIDLQNGENVSWLIALVCIPGFSAFMESKWAWRARKLIEKIPKFGLLAVLIDSMYRIRAVSRKLLAEKMRESHAMDEREKKKDIMSLLVRVRKESLENEPGAWSMDDEGMVDQVLTFLGAGHETTASGLAWTLYLLAANKEVQDKLREEVTPVLAANPRPEYRTLKELQWLDCVVMESLRILPPVPMTFRQAAKTDYVDGVLIPAGTILYIPIRVVNTWKSIWGPDAEEFHPERWLNLPKSYHSHYSLLSFFAGQHACIGKTMAIMEMRTVLASLIANFEFDLAYEGQLPQPIAAITMKPKDNMPLRVRRVQRQSV